MKFIICGAGNVGTNIARYLASEDADVTVIDKNAELVERIASTLDVKAIEGFASHPDVLARAGAEDADMIIAVTYADEVNMVACQVAHTLFNVPRTIARIRSQTYLNPLYADLFSNKGMPIDVIISPEIEVARAVRRRLEIPGAQEAIPLADGLVRLIGVYCDENCPIIDTPLRQLTRLFPDLQIEVVLIMRNDRPIVPGADDVMKVGDEVYFVCAAEHTRRAMSSFGHDETDARRVVVLGGGNIGMFLAKQLEKDHPEVSVSIIEFDPERAESLAQDLRRAVVLQGDCLDTELLDEANVGASETVIAVTNDDETNILASLLAKRAGSKRAITLVNKTSYASLVTTLGVDAVVNPRAITVSTILQHIRRGRIRSVHSLRAGLAEIIEGEALDTSSIIKQPLRDVKFPAGVIVGAIVRGNSVIMPRPETVILPKDRVIVLAVQSQVRRVEKMFAVGLEFF
jgi:trk system potassium uptake protein TrkA